IDQAEIPEIRSLVQVRNAWRGHAQQRLGQAVQDAGRGELGGGSGYLSTQGLAMLAEQQAFGVFTAGALVIAVGIAPGAAQLGFANGLFLPLDDALAEVTHRFAIIGSQFRWPAG